MKSEEIVYIFIILYLCLFVIILLLAILSITVIIIFFYPSMVIYNNIKLYNTTDSKSINENFLMEVREKMKLNIKNEIKTKNIYFKFE